MLGKNPWPRLNGLLPRPFGAVKSQPEIQGAVSSKRLWWLALLVLGLIKIWAVAGDEILVQENDASCYAWSTTGMVWKRANDFLPTHPPGLAMVAGIVAQFGIPWRLALEGFYLAACAGLATALAGLLRSRLVAFLLYVILVFHPWTFSGFHDFMADPFVLVLSVGLLACLLKLLGQSSSQWRWPLFLASGGLLFLWAWSRYEEPLVYGTYALFAFLAWALTQKEIQPAPLSRRLVMLVSPVLISVLLGAAAQTANYSHFGVRAKAQIGLPGLMTLLKALYWIQPERDLLYAPVTHQSLQAACQASPTLKQYEKSLLDTNASAVKFGQKVNKTPGEFGSWLNWLLTQSFPSDPRLANELMLKAAAEVNTALRNAQLPARRAHFPLDPNWRLWAPQLAPSLKEAFQQGSSLKPWTNSPPGSGNTWYELIFDEAANRRKLSASADLIVGNGSITAPPGALDSLVLSDDQGKILGACPLAAATNEQAQAFRFRISSQEKPKSYGLEFFRRGERRFKHPFQFEPERPWVAEKAPTPAALADTGDKITFSYQFLMSGAPSRLTRFQRWQRHAAACAMPIVTVTLVIAAVLLLFGRPWDRMRIRQLTACLLLLAGWFFARTALYGLIKAMVGWGADRYMRCISPLFVLLLILGVALIVAILQRQWRKFGAGKTSGSPAGPSSAALDLVENPNTEGQKS